MAAKVAILRAGQKNAQALRDSVFFYIFAARFVDRSKLSNGVTVALQILVLPV